MNDQITDRRGAFDVLDEVLRPLLGSLEGSSAAMSCWLALRRAGWLMDESDAVSDEEIEEWRSSDD